MSVLLTVALLCLNAHGANEQEPEIPLEQVFVSLESSLGSIPARQVAIHGDGRLVVEELNLMDGKWESHRFEIPTPEVVRLVNLFLSARFFDRAAGYSDTEEVRVGDRGGLVLIETAVSDCGGTTTLELRLGDRQHATRLGAFAPPELCALRDTIDELANTALGRK